MLRYVARRAALLLLACFVAVVGLGSVFARDEPTKTTMACPATRPNGRMPLRDAGVNHGNGFLWVSLWAGGRFTVKPEDVAADGSIEIKFGWWRREAGRLRISGKRIDGASAPLRVHIPRGYGPRGFQASSIVFPGPGCWRIAGRVRSRTLTFVALVTVSTASGSN